MSLFSDLFASSAKVSALEERLQKITVDDAKWAYQNTSDSDLRIPSAITMLVLRLAHNFSKDLVKQGDKFDKTLKGQKHQSLYDIIAFEMAAYIHFWLMKEYLQADVNRLEDFDEDDSASPRYSALVTSTLLSETFIKRYTAFDLPDKFFAHRSMSYCQVSDTKIDVDELISRLDHKLFCSLLAGRPVGRGPRDFGHLTLDVTFKCFIRIFHITQLPALSEIVDELFKYSDYNSA